MSSLRANLAYIPGHLVSLYDQTPFAREVRRQLGRIGQYYYEGRGRGARTLVLLVAGYKPEIWALARDRLTSFIPEEFDVCLLTPGRRDRTLETLCQRQNWSYLSTKANKLALAQNLALNLHPLAENFFKLDEDILVGRHFFVDLLKIQRLIERENRYDISFVAPLLNLNGYCSRIFLDELGCLGEFEDRFGPARQSAMNTPFFHEAAAAEFVWEKTKPFDQLVDRFRDGMPTYSACPHRFSIGAFLMRRSAWNEMGGFSVGPNGALGHEELELAAWSAANSRIIAVAHNVLAGHASFGPQTAHMLPVLTTRPDLAVRAATKQDGVPL